MTMLYAEIILPLAFTGQTFTYSYPEAIRLFVGARVSVSVHGRIHTGIVSRLHTSTPTFATIDILELQDTTPIFTPLQVELMEWIAQYYLCPLGQVLRMTMPIGIRSGEYTPPTINAVRLNPDIDLELAIEALKKVTTAQKALDVYLAMQTTEEPYAPISRKSLLQRDVKPYGLKTLLDRNIFLPLKIPAKQYGNITSEKPEVSPIAHQIIASPTPTLLYNSSVNDPTPLFSELISHTSMHGKMTLVLTPDNFSAMALDLELSSTLQTAPYHTRCSSNVRSDCYLRIAQSPLSLDAVIGTRPALMLPYTNLGLIIVTQESDYGHKASDQSPLYHARDTALMLARLHGAKVLLTTQAPSMEAYAMCRDRRWNMIQPDRERPTAQIKLLEKGKKELFSSYLIRRMEETLNEGNQIVILQNRRGFASWVLCNDCGHIPQCVRCNVMLTLHQTSHTLQCHYCGFVMPAPVTCPQCASPNIQPQGMGTERVVEQLSEKFPLVNIARVDSDSVARSDAFGELRRDIEDSKADIIVGTQLILRGLRPAKVQLAAIINADNMFISTDFRTSERALATLLRLRAMVGNGGELVIQSSNTKNPVLKALEWNEVGSFYGRELQERAQLHYPPFVRLIMLRLMYHDKMRLLNAANELDSALQPLFGNRVTPPYEPVIDRVHDRYILEMMVRFERTSTLVAAKEVLLVALDAFRKSHSWLDMVVDVDPV